MIFFSGVCGLTALANWADRILRVVTLRAMRFGGENGQSALSGEVDFAKVRARNELVGLARIGGDLSRARTATRIRSTPAMKFHPNCCRLLASDSTAFSHIR